jgi:hypothetical protein
MRKLAASAIEVTGASGGIQTNVSVRERNARRCPLDKPCVRTAERRKTRRQAAATAARQHSQHSRVHHSGCCDQKALGHVSAC